MTKQEFLDAVGNNTLPLSYTNLLRLAITPRHFRIGNCEKEDEEEKFEEVSLTKLVCFELFPELEKRFQEKQFFVIPSANKGQTTVHKKERADIRSQAAKVGAAVIMEKNQDLAKLIATAISEYDDEYEAIRACTEFGIYDKAGYEFEGETFQLSRYFHAFAPAQHTVQISVVAYSDPAKLAWKHKEDMWDMQAFIYSHLTETPFIKLCFDRKGHCSPYKWTEGALRNGENQLKNCLRKYNEYRANPRLWNKSWGWKVGQDGFIYF